MFELFCMLNQFAADYFPDHGEIAIHIERPGRPPTIINIPPTARCAPRPPSPVPLPLPTPEEEIDPDEYLDELEREIVALIDSFGPTERMTGEQIAEKLIRDPDSRLRAHLARLARMGRIRKCSPSGYGRRVS
jgi:hypothetical protein